MFKEPNKLSFQTDLFGNSISSIDLYYIQKVINAKFTKRSLEDEVDQGGEDTKNWEEL